MPIDKRKIYSLVQAQKLTDAEKLCRTYCDSQQHDLDAWFLLGLIDGRLGKYQDSGSCFQRILELNPGSAEAYYNLGKIFLLEGQYDKASENFKKTIQLKPGCAEAYNNLGTVLYHQLQLDNAVDIYKQALHFKPDYNNPHLHLDSYLKKQPCSTDNTYLATVYNNLGKVQKRLGNNEGALKYCNKAIELKPDFSAAYYNRATILLLQGDLERGLKEHDYYGYQLKLRRIYNLPYRCWEGSMLSGKTILVMSEQGIGDEIMFVSCLPDLLAQQCNCLLECDSRLQPLFNRSFPAATVIERCDTEDNFSHWQSQLPAIDFYTTTGSIPKHYRIDINNFPKRKSYLIADQGKTRRWRDRYNDLGTGLKVGVSWRGGSNPYTKLVRSIALDQWENILAVENVHFINLQYGDCQKEIGKILSKTRLTLYDWPETNPLKDLDDFAAQIMALDLVISVDNSTVHIAGALGIPVWTLLPHVSNWRWMLEREDSPWYPSMKLFRQKNPGNWKGVLKQVENELKTWKGSDPHIPV